MKALKYLSFVGKVAGFVSALNVIPFVDPKIGVFVFAAASILKDAVNRIGDLLDDGQAEPELQGLTGATIFRPQQIRGGRHHSHAPDFAL